MSTLDVKADRVLDIGGSQNPIKGRTKSWDVKEYLIADLPDPHVELQKPDVELDLNKIQSSGAILHPGAFDLLFCLEVFDYITHPTTALDWLQFFLKVGGTAWVSFPFVYPIHNPKDIDGLRYTEPAIRNLAAESFLSVEEIIYRRPRPGNNYLLQFYSADGMRAADGVDHNVTGYIVRFRKT